MRVQKIGSGGIYLPNVDIYLDARAISASPLFISHAHGDHLPNSGAAHAYATPPTARFMRLRGFDGAITEVDFHEPAELAGAAVTFLPAGHILGSAMIFIESEDGSLLYTGDYRTPPAPTTEGFEAPEAVDYLISEATFGLPIYRWPTHDELFTEVRSFAVDTLNEGSTPIFLAYNLGKAQELLHALAPLGHPVQIHGAGYRLCKVYEEYGYNLGTYEPYDRDTAEGNILVMPASGLSAGMASNIRRRRVAYCSGWASREAERTRRTVDALIPLSDHADFFEILELCQSLRPRHVWITHTPNPDVLQHYLRNEGIESSPLGLDPSAEDI